MKLSVETPYGTVTRTTERPYRFVVVTQGQGETYQRARHEAARRSTLAEAAKYERWAAAAEDGIYHEVYNGGYGHANHTVGELVSYAAGARAKASQPFKFEPGRPGAYGWSQSRSGAQKMADEAAKYGHEGIMILAVTVPVAK